MTLISGDPIVGKTQQTFLTEAAAGVEIPGFRSVRPRPGRDEAADMRVRRGERMVVDDDRVVLGATEVATPTGVKTRFEPLSSVGSLPRVSKPGVTIKKLTLPRIVHQVLSDCEEHWEHLAHGLEDRCSNSNLRSVLVASSLTGEGCTTIATCLAVALARHTSRRVMLVDADFTHPGLAAMCGIKPKCGFEQVLVEGVAIEDAMVACEHPPMIMVPLIHGFEYPAMALQADKIAEVMESLHEHADLIVIDGGCVFAGRSPMPLTNGVDAALLVRHPDKSSDHLLDQLDAYLSERGVCGLGVIENCVDDM